MAESNWREKSPARKKAEAWDKAWALGVFDRMSPRQKEKARERWRNSPVIKKSDPYDSRVTMHAELSLKKQAWDWKVTNTVRGPYIAYPEGTAPTKAKALKAAREAAGMYRRQNTKLDKAKLTTAGKKRGVRNRM
jgi:hypothetical protein